MNLVHSTLACTLLLATGAGAARAELVDIAWDGSGRFEHRATVAPAKFAELCGTLRQGMQVSWDFSAGQPLDFNIHYHEGKNVQFPARQDAMAAAKGRLDVKLDQDYCWMWSNKSTAPVELRVLLQR